MKNFSKSALTYDVLSRLEAIVDMESISEETAKDIEHCAYCSCMGAVDKESAFVWFLHLLMCYYDFDVCSELIEIDQRKHRFCLKKKIEKGSI